MTDVTLSSAVRSNLLSLQNTANMMAKTQERLASGLKVNSALDNPTNFFTASSLNSRANDLGRLLDSVSNATQTLEAADNGISAITNLVESAQATARQAQQTPATVDQTTVSAEAAQTGSATITDDAAAVLTGSTTLTGTDAGSTAVSNGQTLSITVGGDSVTFEFDTDGSNTPAGGNVEIDASGDLDSVAANIQTQLRLVTGGTETVAITGGNLTITADDNTTSISGISGTAASALLGTSTAADPTNAQIGALSGTVTIGSNTLTFGSGNIETRADLETALGGLTGGITGSIDGSNNIQLTGSSGASFTVGGDSANLTALGLTAGTEEATTSVTQVTNPERAEFVSQYNELMGQIDELAEDAGFNGVNLLNGDDLSVIFNEDGSSTLDISGVSFDSAGLGLSQLSATGLDADSDIDAVLTALDTATSSLRSQASEFGSNLSIVETREDFTKSMINTLETGAANLTLADTNEEGANLLALQTRQQLSSTALSLASQADQNVLRLF
ncbi:MAG: flagellar protein [Rhizobiales bacterium]|nr:flagellar protein [Hyphomicrobiales bacterium]MBO6697736.1 flagellar protein [Hyphomicrobiales bacterium]MBO6736009.1 flagellar protein [Hyphomicrobiales bacterium]MBO6912479.1 flagellar protein [Hyphomicrobiales bacterium]MBO6955110.1 flagellar protein [Hyphomicrobiales bacterium]